MKNGYYGLICWIFGIVALAVIAWGCYVFIGSDFSFGSGESGEVIQGEGNGETPTNEAFYID
ncbi:MAG: hypothetical protein LUD22_04545 [Coprobacillus sp.]|nr:hypothetical protein [Coprobacillus sp.]